MVSGTSLSQLQRTLHQIDQMFLIGDEILLVKNRVGNLTVFVNKIAWGYIDIGKGEYKDWPSDWRYHIDEHDRA